MEITIAQYQNNIKLRNIKDQSIIVQLTKRALAEIQANSVKRATDTRASNLHICRNLRHQIQKALTRKWRTSRGCWKLNIPSV